MHTGAFLSQHIFLPPETSRHDKIEHRRQASVEFYLHKPGPAEVSSLQPLPIVDAGSFSVGVIASKHGIG